MEIKAELLKPYTEEERMDFIVEQNHNKGYEIKETETALEAWGITESEKLQEAKAQKLKEALEKAYEYENKTGYVTFAARPVNNPKETQNLSIELFNQAKFFQLLIGFTQGLITEDFIYSTKEDVNVFINLEEAQNVYNLITAALSKLWTVDYTNYKAQIETAATVEEVEAIEIDYSLVKEIETEGEE